MRYILRIILELATYILFILKINCRGIYMMKMIGTIFLLSGGLIGIFIGLYFPNKNITEMKHSSKDIQKLHLRSQKMLDLIIGFVFILLGIFLGMNIFNFIEISLFTSINFFVSKLGEVILNKRYGE